MGRGQPTLDGVVPGAGVGTRGWGLLARQTWHPVPGLSGGVGLRTELGHEGEDRRPGRSREVEEPAPG